MSERVPIVLSLGHVAKLSGTQFSVLHSIATRERTSDYRVFQIRKRSGGKRWICVPHGDLAQAQRWIQREILSSEGATRAISPHSTAFAIGSSILSNAHTHCATKYLVKIDLSDFFDTIDETRVYAAFRHLGYPKLLSFELSRLCTRTVVRRTVAVPPPPFARKRWVGTGSGYPYPTGQLGHLPQGAPTSPMLANLVCVRMDAALGDLASSMGASYTRYADDIVMSLDTNSRPIALSLLRRAMEIVRHHGFSVNTRKVSITPPGARRIVTGLVVNADAPSVPKEMVSRIEVPLYHIRKHGLLSHCARIGVKNPIRYFRHLEGLVRFACGISDSRGTRWFDSLQLAKSANQEVFKAIELFDIASTAGRAKPPRGKSRGAP